jgi:hypothetical protein
MMSFGSNDGYSNSRSYTSSNLACFSNEIPEVEEIQIDGSRVDGNNNDDNEK